MAASWIIGRAVARHFSSGAVPSNAAVSGHGPGGYKLWKKLSFFVAVPAIALSAVNAYLAHQEEHGAPRPEFVPYAYMYNRGKRFPWGEGQRSLFHNPHVNALPTGYEDEH